VLFFLITYHKSILSIYSSCSFIPATLTILRLDFGLFLITYHHPSLCCFFLLTYRQSLLSIHSSSSFIPATLTILRLDFGLFFFNNLSSPPTTPAQHSFHHRLQTQCSMSSVMTLLPIRHSLRSDIPPSRITISLAAILWSPFLH